MLKQLTCLKAVLIAGAITGSPAFADVFVYPAGGQSAEKMERELIYKNFVGEHVKPGLRLDA